MSDVKHKVRSLCIFLFSFLIPGECLGASRLISQGFEETLSGLKGIPINWNQIKGLFIV